MKILAERLIDAVASNNSGRLARGMCKVEDLLCGARLLQAAKNVAVITGFYVPIAETPETDGPPGATVLARALSILGKKITIFTDSLNASAVEACCSALHIGAPQVIESADELFEKNIDLFVYIERLGAASDGCYYNMRGEDISGFTAPLDKGAILAQSRGIPVLAVGDGGNEVGMGLIYQDLVKVVPSFRKCLCAIGCDVLIPSDVSNWGAYALVALLSALSGRWLGHTPEEERVMIDAMIKAGAVDGKTCQAVSSVDGFPASVHEDKIREIKELFTEWEDKRKAPETVIES
ncbi:MAG: DUF4392 domain-containing protein [Thermovirga sp.]|nr:DUF4392 domain-containing protein [Thermovirga sp.]